MITSEAQYKESRASRSYSVKFTLEKGELYTPPHSFAAAAAATIIRS